jgi:hypothetical protein
VNPDGTETVIFEADAVTMSERDEESKDVKGNIRMNVHDIEHHMEVGAETTTDNNQLYLQYDDPDQKGGRRNRVHGQAECPECGQTFVNTARLERHLSVHQVGSYDEC